MDRENPDPDARAFWILQQAFGPEAIEAAQNFMHCKTGAEVADAQTAMQIVVEALEAVIPKAV
jgi:hypothetical protein